MKYFKTTQVIKVLSAEGPCANHLESRAAGLEHVGTLLLPLKADYQGKVFNHERLPVTTQGKNKGETSHFFKEGERKDLQ